MEKLSNGSSNSFNLSDLKKVKFKMKKYFLLTLAIFASVINAQLSENQLDSLVQRTLKEFDVPGISLGITENGKTVYAKGFGVQSLKTNKPMNENTLVGIASNSKGFTCFALAMLVDEGTVSYTHLTLPTICSV